MVFSSFQSLLNSLSLLKTWCFLSPFIYLYFDFIWALPVHDDQVTWSSQGANGEKLHEDWLATVFPAVANRLHRSKPTMLSFDPHAGNRANKTEKRRKFNTQYWYETLMVWNKLITSWKNYLLVYFGGLSTRCRCEVIQFIWRRVRLCTDMKCLKWGIYFKVFTRCRIQTSWRHGVHNSIYDCFQLPIHVCTYSLMYYNFFSIFEIGKKGRFGHY